MSDYLHIVIPANWPARETPQVVAALKRWIQNGGAE